MSYGDTDDMLFGFYSSQESLEVDRQGGSDDIEMLDAEVESDAPMLPFDQTEAESDDLMLEQEDRFGGDAQYSMFATHGSGPITQDGDWVISQVENMLEAILDALKDDDELSIELRTRSRATRQNPNRHEVARSLSQPKRRKMTFPGANPREAWKFTVLVRILELIHSCLVDNVVMTKRDLYYRDPNLFIKQAIVDEYVDDLACTFGVPRSHLNITAASKGLVAGNFMIRRADGTFSNGLGKKEGVLVPKIDDTDVLDLSNISHVLVIEKEATYRSLLNSPYWSTLEFGCLVLTAKGYPDIASRKFLRQIADRSPYTPMSALVDFDPDGIAIMSTYKHGSFRLAHENVTSKDTPGLKLPKLHWLGVQSHQIGRLPNGKGDTDKDTIANAQGLMRPTARDRKKARQMLGWDLCAENGPEPAWRRELQIMLMLNIKFEMQILDEFPGGLVSWLAVELGGTQA